MDIKNWQKVLDLIRNQISTGNFRTWFSQSRLHSIDETKITLSVPSAFIKNQLIYRYDSQIKEAVVQIFNKPLEIVYQIDPAKFLKKGDQPEELDTGEDIFGLNSLPQRPSVTPLSPKYTLKTFVVGLTNNLAYAAAQAIVQTPGTSYNPFFLYGPSGVGKTHLMQAVGNAITERDPSLKLVYVSSERFIVDFIDSLQNRRTADFRKKYRACDVFLIDDIQFLAGKDAGQEEFFHTFNELYSKNSQIILTSDRPPQEMQKLESRLMSRFQGGLMVDIQPPDLETRVAILNAKLQEKGEVLDLDCVNLIAETVQSNTRELEGKLIQILQMSKLSSQPITAETVRTFLGRTQTTIITGPTDYKKVLNTINQYFNIKTADLAGPRRQKEIVLPRQIAMYLMYEECSLAMEKIGQILGGRDHTTVLHGVEKIKLAINRDREIQRLIIEIKQQIAS